ncbi:PHD and RING finger domain-containing protein 1-like isoform X2 [Siniperca chuatsi]|uniref:PHD and RING finger domain-containing protein 1-like isoform X2 n=1 Tax=Siniperca chuatsi TaxID=119488 RepID=UPI001CE16A95|nr:PHD and RING finger domain-containing protein 1-like isoform X2 [Siniperca chuatsi]
MDEFIVLNTEGGEGADFTSDSNKCYICLSPFEKQAVASLENCQHVFCLECILQWSQTANTCPVDRSSFAFIHQRRCTGGDIQKKIKVKTQKKDDDEEEGSNAVVCEECGRSNRRHQLLVCIQCDSGYHMDCLTPSLNTGPEGDWICPECAVTPQHTDGFMVEEEISDGELMDLLAEIGETASTSSRLRPSTTNHRSSTIERRHSQRIQSRASGDPNPRPQTSWVSSTLHRESVICLSTKRREHVPKYLLLASKPAATTDEVAALDHSDTSNATS